MLGKKATPLSVVEHHLALQAQDWPASRWVIGSRLAAAGAPADEATVSAAYNAGEIVRAWPMRGTVHAIAAPDLYWLNELAGRRALRGVERRWEVLGIDEKFLERTRKELHKMLADGRPHTRNEIGAKLADLGIETNGGIRYHMIWYLTQTGSLVMGPVDEASGDHTVVLQEHHLPAPEALDEPARERELVERYLRSHGPAQLDDITWWSGLTKGAIRRGIAALDEQVITFDSGGRELMMLADRYEALDPDCDDSAGSTFALGAFDEHMLAYKDRTDVIANELANKVDAARNGIFKATIVQSGKVVGTWARKPLTNHVRVTVSPFVKLSAAKRKRVEKALEPWGAFVGRELEVKFDD